jgi:2-polyprenyl-3-methyl-5-hydroxy-6-metoxy-1,4-benzoquinol methylase
MQTLPFKSAPASQPVCWCGRKDLQPFCTEYVLCQACGTLVSRVGLTAQEILVADDPQAYYGKNYWLGHQLKELGNPDILERARVDMSERCLYWLRALLCYRLPPGRILEIGCAHGGFVAMLRSIGFDGIGMELSPWVVDFARKTFDIPVLQGRIEDHDLPAQSFDVIVLNDVVEHLVDPLGTLDSCARLLSPDGILVVQMPSFPEKLSYQQMRARKHRFLQLMDGLEREHLNLFSPRAARQMFGRLGFAALDFLPPLFDYDMYLVAGRKELKRFTPEEQAAGLSATPGGRLGLALLDLALRLEAGQSDRAAFLKVARYLAGGPLRFLLRLMPGPIVRSLKRLVRAA